MSKVTSELLAKIFPATPAAKRDRFVKPFNTILPKYEITTKKRFAALIANVGIESDRLKALEEYASGAAYEGRDDLGNVRDGDGVRYKGRDILQTTGRFNYWVVVVTYLRVLTGKDWDSKLAHTDFNKYLKSKEYDNLLKEADKYNVNFLANPELLEKFPHAVEAAGVFVADKNLNKYADKGEAGFFAYAGVLNTGSARKKAMHYDQRLDLYRLAMRVIPDDFNLAGGAVPFKSGAVEESTADGAVETSTSLTSETDDGTLKESSVATNEQDVTQAAEAHAQAPYNEIGFIETMKGDLKAIGGGNLTMQGTSEALQHISGLPEWLTPVIVKAAMVVLIISVIWLIFRVIHYGAHVWKENHRVTLEVESNTSVTRKDIKWIPFI